MKERYLYFRLSGELLDMKVNMWRLVDTICNARNTLPDLEKLPNKLATIQEQIRHFEVVNARILRLNQ